MTDRQRKILSLLFNSATSDGEILNCTKMLRESYNKGELFEPQRETRRNGSDEELLFYKAKYYELTKQVDDLKRRNSDLWATSIERGGRLRDEQERIRPLEKEVLDLKRRLSESEDCYPKAFAIGLVLGAMFAFGLAMIAKGN